MSEPRGCCRCCASFLFTLGLTALLLWFTYRPIRPRYFLVSLQLPPINGTAPPGNVTAYFTVEVENKNKQMGVLHDPLAVSLAYRNRSGEALRIPEFYQGHHKTADKNGTVGAMSVPWGAAAPEVTAKGEAVFRVVVVTGYRYKVLFWKGRHHAVRVGADVKVDGEGKKKGAKGIRLSSSGAPPPTGAGALEVAAAVLLLVAAAVAIAPVPSPWMLI